MNPRIGAVRAAVALSGAAILAIVLSGCGTTPVPVPTPSSDILTRVLPADVSPEGVLKAAILLKIANIEDAVQQGLVTPAEVVEARAALAAGTLDFWKQRAELNPAP